MESIIHIQVNVFALIILFLIYGNMRRHPERRLPGRRLFMTVLYFVGLLLLLDSVLWYLDGKPGELARETARFLTMVNSGVALLPCAIWSAYVHNMAYRNKAGLKKLLLPLLLPAALGTVLSALSYFNGAIYYFDANNAYRRGEWFPVMSLIGFAYLAYTQAFIAVKHKAIGRKYFAPLFAFGILPILGGLLQALCYGMSVILPCVTISILTAFISLQNHQVYTDDLTGLYNRRQLDHFLYERFKSKGRETLLAGIMIDLNSFKEINDLWGHAVGDRAIVDVGEILKKSFRKEDLICRYGGDEFVVITEVGGRGDLQNAVERIRANARRFQKAANTPYIIKFSMGYDIYDCGKEAGAQQFIRHLDNLMYQDKKRRQKQG